MTVLSFLGVALHILPISTSFWCRVTWRERTPPGKFPAEAPPRASSPASLSFLGFDFSAVAMKMWGKWGIGNHGKHGIRGYSWIYNIKKTSKDWWTCRWKMSRVVDDFPKGHPWILWFFPDSNHRLWWGCNCVQFAWLKAIIFLPPFQLMSHFEVLTFQQSIILSNLLKNTLNVM